VVLKGSVGQGMALGRDRRDESRDVDVAVNIDAMLPAKQFSDLHSKTSACIARAMSEHKRNIDREGLLVDRELFRPRRSYEVIHAGKDQPAVIAETPFLQGCHRLPLKSTPMYLTHSEEVSFWRDAAKTLPADFELFRLRVNAWNSTVGNVPVDLVDVSVPRQGDHNLVRYWDWSRRWNTAGGVPRELPDGTALPDDIVLPGPIAAADELRHMLFCYDAAPQVPISAEKRARRLAMYTRLCDAMFGMPPRVDLDGAGSERV
jgi:hypothetical protein